MIFKPLLTTLLLTTGIAPFTNSHELDNTNEDEILSPDILSLDVGDNEGLRGNAYTQETAVCDYYDVVKIGVVYDSEFCGDYGSKPEAENAIYDIVEKASSYYEDAMCVKLELTDVLSPDSHCGGKSFFDSFNRDITCGTNPSFLGNFKDYINANDLGIDPNADVQMFSGYKVQGTVGCAYIGAFCTSSRYGVNYIGQFKDNLVLQSVVLAHELGHNLNARHINDPSNPYVMRPSVSARNTIFHERSIASISSFLDRVDCDYKELKPTPAPSLRPTHRPTIRGEAPTSRPIRKTPPANGGMNKFSSGRGGRGGAGGMM